VGEPFQATAREGRVGRRQEKLAREGDDLVAQFVVCAGVPL